MADGSDTTVTLGLPAAASLVSGIKEFAGAHGGAKAVIEYVGRKGARIVLVGNDGEWGDQFADSTKAAREACEKAGVTVENEWERELIELMRPTNDLWRSMAKRTLAR
jgi:sugar phosphate isomerase/epimerase